MSKSIHSGIIERLKTRAFLPRHWSLWSHKRWIIPGLDDRGLWSIAVVIWNYNLLSEVATALGVPVTQQTHLILLDICRNCGRSKRLWFDHPSDNRLRIIRRHHFYWHYETFKGHYGESHEDEVKYFKFDNNTW